MFKDSYGPKPRIMKWVFTGIIRPSILYCCLACGQRVGKYADKLRRINRLAMNTFTHIPRSTPTRALEMLLGIKNHYISKFNAVDSESFDPSSGSDLSRTAA